ncbi:hypothetical protein EVA_03455 [gut metagenome]|uniref:DUF4248 domain-containing protein n=1 Tax=gut metagenome TaxID=749906 RepID=J9GKT4_9ZZZZ
MKMQARNEGLTADEEWEVHPYSKRELAMAYAPEISPTSAVNRLKLWIHHHRALYEALQQSGYQDRQRLFNSRQVELIFQYLGKP